ncbi:MAG TPA: hypothetical protein VFI66_05100 [Gemmatimonadales bacterium]|nr:hypothetical protein [Gemmatimonadales bacterium]
MFAALAPVSFVVVPFAALLVASRPTSRREWVVAGLAGAAATALLAAPERGLFEGVARAWIVLVTVAFATIARLRPARFWALALRACVYGGAGIAVLAPAAAGATVWRQVQWEATRDASRSMRFVVEIAPGLYPVFEPAVRIVAGSWPVWLVLATLAGLALAWRGHAVVHGSS